MADIVLGLLSKFISPKSPQKVAIIVLILHGEDRGSERQQEEGLRHPEIQVDMPWNMHTHTHWLVALPHTGSQDLSLPLGAG